MNWYARDLLLDSPLSSERDLRYLNFGNLVRATAAAMGMVTGRVRGDQEVPDEYWIHCGGEGPAARRNQATN